MAILIWAATVRFLELDRPGLWLDEILGVWNVGPEHGPIYYAVVNASNALGGSEKVIRLPFALSGIAAVALIYLATSRVAGAPAGLVAATLLASSPIHVYYSRDARPYALLFTEALLGLIALIRIGQSRPSWSWYVVFGASIALLIETSSNGIFYGGSLLAGLAVLSVQADLRGDTRKRLGLAAGSALLGAAVFMMTYRDLMRANVGGWAAISVTADSLRSFAAALLIGHSERQPVTSVAYGALAIGVLGALLVPRARRVTSMALAAMAIMGFFAPIIALHQQGHGVSVRYLLPALPPVLMLIAIGLMRPWEILFDQLPSQRFVLKRRLIAVATGLTIVTVASTSGLRIHQAVTDKADWRHVAKFIAERTRPGDLVLTSNDWAAVCLAYYLPKVGAQVEIVSAKESVETADELARSRGQAFLVTGGFHVQRDVRTWMGQFFSLFESRLETIGIFFYPDRAAYLANRITQRELRQDDRLLWETHAGRLRFDANIERFLVDGWTHAEPDASGNTLRYSVGAAARLYVPISKSAPSVMKVQLRPINHVPLVLKIKVNDVVVGQHRLRPDWQELTVGFSEAPVRYGGNIVAFEFQAAVDAPSWDTNHGRRTTAFRSLEFIK